VTEFLEHGSLYDYLRNTGKMDASMLASMVRGIAAGMLHLHREGIIHRDLAARNILLGKGYQVKISDFGMSRMTEKGGTSSQTKSDTGPLKWMAPESIRSRMYSVKSDVWGFGVTIWEIVSRQEPYADLDAVQTALDVTHNGRRLEIPEYCPPVLKEIMTSCFQTAPEDRPDFDIISKKLGSAPLDHFSGPFNALNPNNNVATGTQHTSAPGNQASQQYGSLNDQ
jgi:serine/threonine protein kinase